MNDEHEAVIDPADPMFLTFNGRRMARVMGAEDPPDTGTEAETAEPGTEPESAPPEGTRAEEPDTDWEKRYKDLQSSYTKTTQEAAELREWRTAQEAESAYVDALNNPETQDAAVASLVDQLGEDEARDWLEAHGFELEEGDDDETREFRDPRVDQILAERQETQIQQQVAEVETQLNAKLDELAEAKKINLDVKVGDGADAYSLRDVILDAAAVHAGPDSPPDVERAFNVLLGFQTEIVKGYRQTKRGQSTPPQPGQPGTPATPLGDTRSRLELAAQVAEESYQSSS